MLKHVTLLWLQLYAVFTQSAQHCPKILHVFFEGLTKDAEYGDCDLVMMF